VHIWQSTYDALSTMTGWKPGIAASKAGLAMPVLARLLASAAKLRHTCIIAQLDIHANFCIQRIHLVTEL
jgi:hypothetical protein